MLAWVLVVPPAVGADTGDRKAPKGSRVYGKVRDGETDRPLAGAWVRLYHLGGEGTFSSEPTPANGSYEIRGLPFGYFDIVVQTEDGSFVSGEVVTVPPAGKVLLLLEVVAYEDRPESWWATHGRRPLPKGAPGGEATGIADVRRKPRGAEFWKSPKGVLIIAGAGAAVLFVVASSDTTGEETPASPSSP